MSRTWVSRGMGAWILATAFFGCGREPDTLSPTHTGPSEAAITDARVPQTPEAAVDELQRAYNARDARALVPLLGGRYLFYTSTGPGLPTFFTRGQVLASTRSLFMRSDVTGIEMMLTHGDALPANDPAYASAMRIDGTVSLTITMDGGEPVQVTDLPFRVYLAKGPAYSNLVAGWQIVGQWDPASELERPIVGVTWSDVIAMFLPKPTEDGSL